MLKGFIIGIVMMIPGLSGGSCAMILKVYDKLINSITNIKENFLFLFKIGIGIVSGIIFFSLILFPITNYNFFSYLVTIIIIINIILLLKEFEKIKFQYILLVILGYLLISILNKNNLIFKINLNIISYFFIGIILAVSLILPGLGASYVLYTLNLYETFNNSIINFDFIFLGYISLFTIIGIFITAKLLNYILIKDKFLIYSLVIGLLIGSI